VLEDAIAVGFRRNRRTDRLRVVEHLARSHKTAVVVAASGMCAGRRVVDYLAAMLGDPRHDILFVAYQAAGTPGRDIQRYSPRGGYVVLLPGRPRPAV
jgi:metallo-beta-lactamase family protein